MPLYTELPPEITEVDVIIAGGGTVGCIVASRLSDADPSLSMLVIENGGQSDGMATKYPVLFMTSLDPSSKFMRHHVAKATEHVAGRKMDIPHANILGGGSTVNLMTYSRPNAYDFDAWNTPEWSFKEVAPYMKKFENYYGPGENYLHGKGGPIDVSDGTMVRLKTQNDFIAAAAKLGLEESKDIQDFFNPIGVQRNLQYVSPKGERQDTASKYLLPRLADGKHPHLHVVLRTRTEKVLFDENKKAVGVICASSVASDQQPREVRAKRQVVVCCGTFDSPQVLQRSGIGNAKVLQSAGVNIVAENDAIGENFQEHLILISVYKSNLGPEDTLDDLARGKYDVQAAIERDDPILGWTAMDTICQVRPTDEQVAALGDDFKARFDKFWGPDKTKVMGILTALNSFPAPPPPELDGEYIFGTTAFATYPFARGHVRITGPKSSDPVDFQTGFLEDEGDFDLKSLRYLYKTQREIIRRMDLYRGEIGLMHPDFPANSAAALHEGPLSGDIKDIEYTAADDEVIDQWIRKTVATAWHGLGTCRMGKQEEGGAVDERLNVYGVSGVKVADLSVVPGNVAANTNSTALMIGEKVSDILIDELGLSK